MNEHDELIARLRALGERPVEPAVASRHLTAMAAVGGRRAARFGPAKAAAAFVAGLVLGTTGLASAGVLPDRVQDSVADAAAKVGVNLPGGTERVTAENTPGACKIDGVTVTTVRNHGDFVKRGGDPKDPCGKPKKAADQSNRGTGADDENRSECAPPWAGKGRDTKRIKEENPNWTPPAPCPADEAEARENEGKKPEETPAPQSQVTPAPEPQGPPSTTPAPAAGHGQEQKAENAPETTGTAEAGGLENRPEDVPPAP